MTKANVFPVLAIAFALGVAGCASAQPKEPHTMLIDKISPSLWNPQTALSGDQDKEQQTLIDSVNPLLKGKYQITAARSFELPPIDGVIPNPAHFKMTFTEKMEALNASLAFENATFDQPYLTVWETRDPHPEYAAIAMLRLPNNNTVLGYFELVPKP